MVPVLLVSPVLPVPPVPPAPFQHLYARHDTTLQWRYCSYLDASHGAHIRSFKVSRDVATETGWFARGAEMRPFLRFGSFDLTCLSSGPRRPCIAGHTSAARGSGATCTIPPVACQRKAVSTA